eukprot:3633961-Alexandrium_andersonii.AAC.1
MRAKPEAPLAKRRPAATPGRAEQTAASAVWKVNRQQKAGANGRGGQPWAGHGLGGPGNVALE